MSGPAFASMCALALALACCCIPVAAFRETLDITATETRISETTAFCLAGATGDNAIRKGGVYHGLFEAWASSRTQMRIFAMINGKTPDRWEKEIQKHKIAVLASVTKRYDDLTQNAHWHCVRADCTPQKFVDDIIQITVAESRSPQVQAEGMEDEFHLTMYKDVTLYLSLPPKLFGDYAQAAQEHWGKSGTLHLVAEKPFGTSVDGASTLYNSIAGSGVDPNNIHLVDHFVALWMMRTMSDMKKIAKRSLGIPWNSSSFSKIVFVQGEGRGLEGRGSFFDSVGQSRDMVQSHLLQVMSATLALPESTHSVGGDAKLSILKASEVKTCESGQYEGFLNENDLNWHPDYADATYIDMHLGLKHGHPWSGVDVEILTAKAMNKNHYGIDFYQRDGPGVLTFEIGQHKFGVGGISVKNWKLAHSFQYKAPMPGQGLQIGWKMTSPKVDEEGNGYILKYSLTDAYFPSAYAVLMQALVQGEYTANFVTWEECLQMWKVMTPGGDKSMCLDPPSDQVMVYPYGLSYGQGLPSDKTVSDLYTNDFECSPENNKQKGKIHLYINKCCGGWNRAKRAWNECE